MAAPLPNSADSRGLIGHQPGYHHRPMDIHIDPSMKPDTIRFETGAKRCKDVAGDGEIPLRFDLIPPVALERIARRYGMGALKYGDNNYQLGIPATNILNHLQAHINKYRMGDRTDDHLAGAVWGLLTLMWYDTFGNPADKVVVVMHNVVGKP